MGGVTENGAPNLEGIREMKRSKKKKLAGKEILTMGLTEGVNQMRAYKAAGETGKMMALALKLTPLIRAETPPTNEREDHRCPNCGARTKEGGWCKDCDGEGK